MEYQSKYMADYYEKKEPQLFDITQEVTVLRTYTVEAESMVDAIQQIEHQNYDCIVAEDNTHAEERKGRIVRVTLGGDSDES